MKILQRRGSFVDVEVADGVRLFNLKVKRAPDGSTRVYAPNAYGSRVASLSPAVANQIATALTGDGKNNILNVTAFSRRDGTRSMQVNTCGSRTGGVEVNLISIDAAAERTGLSRSSLAKYRCNGVGPAFYKIGRAIRYDSADLDAGLLTRRRVGTWQTANDSHTAVHDAT